MSIMKKSVIVGFLTAACAVATSAYASDPDVVAMHATFITKTNTKDQNPHLDVQIYNSQNVLVAENKDIPGNNWNDNSINSISLDLKKDFKRSDLASGKVKLTVHPEGKEQWNFDYNIATTYSNNKVVWERWSGKELSQSKASISDTLTGK